MRPGGGRVKGSAFERKVSKLIVRAFAPFGVTAMDCYRTPSSGGHRFALRTDPGDLVISPRLRRYFNFAVECKFYARCELQILLHHIRRGPFGAWWQQACVAAEKVDKLHLANECPVPLLVFKANRGDIYAMLPLEVARSKRLRPAVITRIRETEVKVVQFDCLLEYLQSKAERKKRHGRAA